MRIVIEKDNIIDEAFIKWLIRFIKSDIIRKLNNRHLNRLNNYINTNNTFEYDKSINVKKVIIQSLNTLGYKKSGNHYIITFNEIIPFYSTKFKLKDILNFITYGNFEIKGCSIISEVFDSIQNNLELYKKLYLGGYII